VNAQTDPDFLKNEAYKDASNFDLRQRLTEQHRAEAQNWYQWVYQQLHLPTGGWVLDIGCGPGHLWLENWRQLPAQSRTVLIDLSWGMVNEGRRRLERRERQNDHPPGASFFFAAADTVQLPFPRQQFDVVLALGLLDHVPHRLQALEGIQQTLKPAGRAYFSAGSRRHLQELDALVAPFMEETNFGGDADRFGLHNGHDWLAPFFRAVSLTKYESALIFHSAEPVLAYALSETAVKKQLHAAGQAALEKAVRRMLQRKGEIRLTIEKGVFAAAVR
jgi:ubiquinone/menaquinone biosynthesis C-methylase UbiE